MHSSKWVCHILNHVSFALQNWRSILLNFAPAWQKQLAKFIDVHSKVTVVGLKNPSLLQFSNGWLFFRAFRPVWPGRCIWALSVCRSRLAPWTRLRPLGHGRYRFATASASSAMADWCAMCWTINSKWGLLPDYQPQGPWANTAARFCN